MKTILVLSALVLSAGTAQAAPFNCSTDVDGSKLETVVTIGDSVSTSTLSLDGKPVPAVGNCFEMQRPSTRYLRCSHQLGDLRVEIYPWVETTDGSLKSMEVVIWHGARAERGSFSCN